MRKLQEHRLSVSEELLPSRLLIQKAENLKANLLKVNHRKVNPAENQVVQEALQNLLSMIAQWSKPILLARMSRIAFA